MTRRSPTTAAVLGAVVAVVLGWNAVLAGLVGGFVAGYVAGDGRRGGLRTGVLAGAIAVTPALVVVAAGVAFDFEPAVLVLLALTASLRVPGVFLAVFAMRPVGIALALVVATAMVLGLAAGGGYLGGYAAERESERSTPPSEVV